MICQVKYRAFQWHIRVYIKRDKNMTVLGYDITTNLKSSYAICFQMNKYGRMILPV